MRISTSTMYESGVARMSELQSGLLKTQQQISTGRRILTPADDPVGAARALDLKQAQAINSQFKSNREMAGNALAQEEGALQSLTSLLQDLKVAVVQAGNAALDDSQRRFIAEELRGRFDDMMGLANSRDGNGNAIFGGYQITGQPFAQTAAGAAYNGDQGQALLQVDSARQMAIGDSGFSVFENIPSSGTFSTAALGANTGSGSISALTVTDARSLTGHNYDIVFSGGGTTWSVYDVTLDPTRSGTPAATGPYTAGAAIPFDNVKASVSGAPADGDVFTVRPQGKQSMFATLTNLIAELEKPVSNAGATGSANLTHGLSVANGNFDKALDSVLALRASVGARMKELDSLNDAGDGKDIQYTQSLQQIEGLDYNRAISDLTQQQMVLSAAQQSFVKIAGLSLFNLI